MEGEYSRQTSRGMAHIPVTLVPHREVTGDSAWTGPTLTGTWVFHRPSETGAEKSTLAEFQQQKTANADGKAEATGNLRASQRRYRAAARICLQDAFPFKPF